MAKASENVFPKVQFSEETAPATPSAGEAVVYVKSDGKLYLKDDAGTETDLTASGGGTTSLCIATRATDQSIPNTTFTAVEFTAEDADTDTYHDNSTNPSRFTVPADGQYQVNASIQFTASTGGAQRAIKFRVDGTTYKGGSTLSETQSGSTLLNATDVIDLSSGSYVEVMAYQDSGGSLNAEGGNLRMSIVQL